MTEALAVFALAAAPVSELRGAIPLGIAILGMPVPLVVVLSILGNLVPVVLIYAVGDAWMRWVERKKGFVKRLTDRVLGRAQRKFNGKYELYGLLALTIFVAVPLPVTGAWTGTLAAYIIGMPFRKAFPYVAAGIVIAATVVTLATTGVISFLDFML